MNNFIKNILKYIVKFFNLFYLQCKIVFYERVKFFIFAKKCHETLFNDIVCHDDDE